MASRRGLVRRAARRVVVELRQPRVAWPRLVRWVRWRLRLPAYRRAVADDRLIVVPEPPPGDVLFSVVTPVYRVSQRHLESAVESVRSQTYSRWELVLVDDASPAPGIPELLNRLADADERVGAVHLKQNLGIGVAANEAARHASGEFLVFLDHDDRLHPRALELVARRLRERPDADWLFTDEDKIDEHGRHHSPCLKPGWSPHLLLTFNDVCHVRVIRRRLFEELGGHRAGFDGAQDYDLALRAWTAGATFEHLPGVLYHWRTVPGSMARAAADKPAAHGAAVRALREAAESFPGNGEVTAEILLEPASFFRVRRTAFRELGVTVLDGGGGGVDSPRVGESVPLRSAAAEDVVDAVRSSSCEVVVLPPPDGFGAEALEELLALLNVPGTAVVAARAVSGRRVVGSGWWGVAGGRLRDPWAGLDVDDPGPLNLAMAPGPRLILPPVGWVARRDWLLRAWEETPDVPSELRLGVGWARLGRHAVVTPEVSWVADQSPSPPRGHTDIPVLEAFPEWTAR